MRRVAIAIVFSSRAAFAKDTTVTTDAELTSAIAAAQPGDNILLADGTYNSTGYSCDASGTAQSPITVRAQHPLLATVRFNALEGFHVNGDYWHFENLAVQGVCPVDDNCEHAFHVTGASGFSLKGSKISDFNAQLKVNAVPPKLPQAGLVEGNEIFDTRARMTANPTTKLDIDSGDDWIVRANIIRDFEKGGGDNISYGAFMKCGGLRGIMERNLVLCTSTFGSGTRIGLSLGGGGCGWQYCEPAFDANVPCLEHTDGIVRNNIITQCSDVGIYVNQAKNSQILYNTVIATSGIDYRFSMTTGDARGNVLEGSIRNRDGSTGVFANNLEGVTLMQWTSWYIDPFHGVLKKKGDLSMLIGMGMPTTKVTDDYCARMRSAPYDLGALQASLGDCSTTPPVGDAGSDGSATTDAGDAGTDATPDGGTPKSSSGCSCDTTAHGNFSLETAFVMLLLFRRDKWRSGRRSG